MRTQYERLEEDGSVKHCPMNDYDGSITGRIVYNVPAYFNENPSEAKRLGWIRHDVFEPKEIKERWPHNPRTQYLTKSIRVIDAWTVEDDYHVMDKSEEMLEREELTYAPSYVGGLAFDGGDFDEL